jgi:hypothetical protein
MGTAGKYGGKGASVVREKPVSDRIDAAMNAT